MSADEIANAQQGIVLADALEAPPPRSRPRRGPSGESASASRRSITDEAAAPLTGPFLSPNSLTAAERRRLIDGIERVLEGLYTHLPLKRARYGFDPVQRLRILRSQVAELTDDAFHIQLADIVTGLRDAHTRYAGPRSLSGKVAALPFMVEMVGSAESPSYVVTKVGRGLDDSFRPGVVLEYWNGVPIDRAVQRHSEQEVGGRPDSLRAWSVQSLTLRSLRYGPPPDEHWVIIGYRTATTGGAEGQTKETKIPWRIVDPDEIAAEGKGPSEGLVNTLREALAVDPASEAVRRAKMLLFASHALVGEQATPPPSMDGSSGSDLLAAEVIDTRLTQTLKAMSIDAPDGPFGYLRIFAFDTLPDAFIEELDRLIPLLPDRGLIIDIRANPGGYIWAAELALQLFTPNPIEPTRFSALATPFTRQLSTIGALAEDLRPWKPSLDAAVRNGELYGQTIPITDPAACNELGQRYGGPVLLVADSTTYSAGDLFSAGFVDNRIGPFLCVGSATGAGGANVWNYGELNQALAGSTASLPGLPDGIDLSFSYRRATRSGPSEGLPIEDVGVEGMPYAMTKDDVLRSNRDLITKCVAILKQQALSRLSPVVDAAARSIEVATSGLNHVDTFIDGHPGTATTIQEGEVMTINYPTGAELIELVGFYDGELRQRRKLHIRR
jgi:hypothetical protein